MVHEREKCTPLRLYNPRAVNVWAELNVYGNVVYPYHEFYFIYHKCVRCKFWNMKVQTKEKISCNFREKVQIYEKCKCTGSQIQ